MEPKPRTSRKRSGRGAFPVQRSGGGKPAVERWEVRMLARVTKDM
uniref:Uncharacterized protein n=1 Tax=uncultured bacterium 5G12 TaxID=1701325 RepID=A0A0N9HQF3_9BACT|nr:hypothetical protein 5G12_014 [uncultured bacterium 5G12]